MCLLDISCVGPACTVGREMLLIQVCVSVIELSIAKFCVLLVINIITAQVQRGIRGIG
jgi:hypothetical protein